MLLHDHLDGGLRPATVIELARECGYGGAADDRPRRELGEWFASDVPRRDLVRYLEGFEHTVGVMQTQGRTRSRRVRVRRGPRADGVVYAEVRFAPELHTERGLDLDTVVESVLAGFESGASEAAAAGRPIVDPGAAHRHAHRGEVP